MRYTQLIQSIGTASDQLLGRAAAVVNQALVLRNWLVGAWIVEYEQGGKDRAKYGMRLLETMAADLAGGGVKGLSLSTLERCRQIFFTYPQIALQIPSTLLTESVQQLAEARIPAR